MCVRGEGGEKLEDKVEGSKVLKDVMIVVVAGSTNLPKLWF